MSSEALAWAFKQDCPSSSVKFTLVALCECANYQTGRIYPSVAHITEITGQNRKTIIANIAELERLGFIADTGERAGATRQIKVYQAALGTVPKAEPSQKRNSSENGVKQSQKRDTEPSRTFIDKAKALPIQRKRAAVIKPDGVSDGLWSDWLSHRDGKFSQTALDGFEREAAKAGWTVAEAFTEAIERKWQGFKADWVKEKKNGNSDDGIGRTERAAMRALRDLGAMPATTCNGAGAVNAVRIAGGNATAGQESYPMLAIGNERSGPH
jgi:hypothetical protein